MNKKKTVIRIKEKNGKLQGEFIGWDSKYPNVGWIKLDNGEVLLGNKRNIIFI